MMIKRILHRAKLNIIRSGWRAYALVFMMVTTYIILGVLLVVLFASRNLAQYFIERTEVIGFFKDGTTEEQISEIKIQLEKFEYVVDIRYVSKEDALKSFIEKNQNRKDLLESITANPLPAHLNVKVNDLDKVSAVSDFFRSNDKVDRVIASERVLDTLRKIVLTIQGFGLGLLVVFSASTFIIILLTIGISVYSQKDEIIVMKLVGATNAFVRMPYVFQSLFLGLISALIASSMIAGVLILSYTKIMTAILGQGEIPPIPMGMLLAGVLIEILFASILSIISSYIATRRYIAN